MITCDVVGKAARELARVDAAEAPADQAELPPVPRAQRREPLAERRGEPAARPEVPTELPAVDVVAAVAEEPAQGLRRAVVREPARQHQDRMAVAGRRPSEERQRRQQGGELEPGPPLEGEQRGRGRPHRLHGCRASQC